MTLRRMAMIDRYTILQASENFTKEQRTRLINSDDIVSARLRFNFLIAAQLRLDHWVGFKAWDSFSMILQHPMCVPDNQIDVFVRWAFDRLGYQEQPPEKLDTHHTNNYV